MVLRLVQSIVAAWICYEFIVALSGCAAGHSVWYRTEIRDLPDQLETKLTVGDTREEVRHLLGNPLLDARNLEVELYRKSGRDMDYDWAWVIYVPVVFPDPGQKVIAFIMVAYDEHDVVKEIKTEFWIPDQSLFYWVDIGGFSFVNSYYNEPDTILAPPVTWDDLSVAPVVKGRCALVLLMGECPMEEVSLDNSTIVDLSPAGGWCGVKTWQKKENNFYGAFIRKEIIPGTHRLDVNQKTKHGEFVENFSCVPGETVFAELKARHTSPYTWPDNQLQGEISISKNPRKNVLDIDVFHPIIWHDGKWFEWSATPAKVN